MNNPKTPPPSAPAAGSDSIHWAVACVLVENGTTWAVNICLRHSEFIAVDRNQAIGAATSQALDANPGWQISMVSALEIRPNTQASDGAHE